MGSINGIGTKFYGFSELAEDNSCYATLWFIFLFLPIFPLKRLKIRRDQNIRNQFIYTQIETTAVNLKEILRTYLVGLVIMPIIIAWPLVLSTKVGDALGLPSYSSTGLFRNPGLREFIFIFAIVWFATALIFWKNWDDKKGLR